MNKKYTLKSRVELLGKGRYSLSLSFPLRVRVRVDLTRLNFDLLWLPLHHFLSVDPRRAPLLEAFVTCNLTALDSSIQVLKLLISVDVFNANLIRRGETSLLPMASSLNGSASNLPDGAGRSFATSFSGQSGAASPIFHHTGAIQGLHNIHGSFNVPNMPGTLTSRNSSINNVPSGGVQQPTGSLSSGRFASNNLPVALSQLSHGSSHGHSGVTNRGGISVVGNPGFSSSTNGVGGSIPGILPTSAAIGNRNAVPGLGVSPILGNAGPRITSSVGNMVGGGNIGRTGGGLSVPGLASRLNLGANSGSGGLSIQGQNRLMSGVLPQGSPQVISMLGNSYPSGGPLSQSHVQAVSNLSSMGMLNDVNSSDNSPFDLNDFPQLTSRPSSAGGPQGQL
ncbi:putative NOT transcription complex subunit VIP2 isoform X2, partial [Sesbania bispinosa]